MSSYVTSRTAGVVCTPEMSRTTPRSPTAKVRKGKDKDDKEYYELTEEMIEDKKARICLAVLGNLLTAWWQLA